MDDFPSTNGIGHLMNKADVCKILGIEARTLEKYMSERKIPFIRFNSRCIRFRPEHIRRVLDELTIGPR